MTLVEADSEVVDLTVRATHVAAGRRAATPVHVFALLADMDYYVRRLSAPGFMMCTAELRQLARSSGP